MPTLLQGLARASVIVADTGELEAIERFRPRDATTNPSLILKAAQQPRYRELLEQAVRDTAGEPDRVTRAERLVESLVVAFGCRILELVPGRVSTEVDARLSFDTTATEAKARRLISLYEARGVARERVLIKIAATWEGIRAAERLERDGIHCNLTLVFSLVQAVACAEAGAKLISPFVGRIYDWYRAARGSEIPDDDDPGVESVTRIYQYLRGHGHATEIMGASFRRASQILALAGCDLLTISPELLTELSSREGEVPVRLDPSRLGAPPPRIPTDEAHFRWQLNEDAMATEKLAEGIRRFHADADKLIELASAVA